MTDAPMDPQDQQMPPETSPPQASESYADLPDVAGHPSKVTAMAPEASDLPDVPGEPAPRRQFATANLAHDGAQARGGSQGEEPDVPAEVHPPVEDSPSRTPTTEPVASAASPVPEPRSAPLFPVHSGRVVRVTAEEVVIALDDGREGTVPLIEFAGQPLPVDGDGVSVIIETQDPQSGRIVLSKRHADELGFWEAVAPGDELAGVVTGMNKGGLDIDIGGARAFLPASQVDTHRMKDISTLIGEHVRCLVVQVDRITRDLIVSRKRYLEKQVHEERRRALEGIAEGEIRSGTVISLTQYGAFIDLGGVDGLLHMSDISWGRVKDPREVLQVGQPLRVRVLKINRETGKVSLGLKQVKPNPWEGVEQRYPRDRRLRARVARMTEFGAFLELEEGVDALLPIGEMSWSRHVSHPADVVQIGQEIEVAVLRVDPVKKRISVGLRQTQENPWTNAETRFPVNARIRGKVVKIAEFGAFVEITPGIEGLVHISEMSEKRVRSAADVVQEGQEVEVRVVKVDVGNQRVSLSMRPEPKVVPRMAEAPADKRKDRKNRPLRGGLSSHFEW